MKRKAIIPLVLGLGIGLLAVKFGVDAIRKAKASGQAQKTVAVVQAKVDIDSTAEIRPDMLETAEMIENPLIPPMERLGEMDKVVGRVASKSIPKGSPVLASMLAPLGTAPGLAGRIPPGFRACAVKIDETSSASYQLKSGDWVDVIVVMDVETGRRKKETIAEVILQHIEVASVGYGSTPAEDQKSITKVKPAKSATLLVAEQDVPKLHLAGTRGKITLAMRGEDDTISADPIAARAGELGGIFNLMNAGPDEVESANSAPSIATEDDIIGGGKQEGEMEPFSVMVVRGAQMAQPGSMESITFEDSKSPRIVQVNVGAPTQTAALIRQQSGRRAQRAAMPANELPREEPMTQEPGEPIPVPDVSDNADENMPEGDENEG